MKEMMQDEDDFLTTLTIRMYVFLKVGAWLLSVHVNMYGWR